MANAPLRGRGTSKPPAIVWPEGVEVPAPLDADPRMAPAARILAVGWEALGVAPKFFPAADSRTALGYFTFAPIAMLNVMVDGRMVVGAMSTNQTTTELDPADKLVEVTARNVFLATKKLDEDMRERAAAAYRAVAEREAKAMAAEIIDMAKTQATKAVPDDCLLEFDAGFGDIFRMVDDEAAALYRVMKAVTVPGKDDFKVTGWKEYQHGFQSPADCLRAVAQAMDEADAEATAAEAQAQAAAATPAKPAKAPKAAKPAEPPAAAPKAATPKGKAVLAGVVEAAAKVAKAEAAKPAAAPAKPVTRAALDKAAPAPAKGGNVVPLARKPRG